LQTDWQTADARNDRDRIDRVRQEAENLFRPKQAAPHTEAAEVNGSSATDLHPPRQPRVFRIPPVVPMAEAKSVVPTARVRAPRQRIERRKTHKIPASQFGRVRALAGYGMTCTQVAELYGVGIDEVERILSDAGSTKINGSRNK
jgi:hypothetical protein